MELACSAAGSKLVELSIERAEQVGRRSGKEKHTFEGVGLCRNQSALGRSRWATFIFQVVGCTHVAGITVRNETISILFVSLSHAVPPRSRRFGSCFRSCGESAVERRSGSIGQAEDCMYFRTVSSVTFDIFDILLSGAKPLSERRVLETGHV